MNNKKKLLKAASVRAFGLLLVFVGIVLLFIPGPGLLTIAVGGAIFFGRSEEAKEKAKEFADKAKDKLKSRTEE